MQRFHVHVGVSDLDAAIRFYSDLFATTPAVRKDDYAKWMLEDPRLNFAISTRGKTGLHHLGLQTDTIDELKTMHDRLTAAGETLFDQGPATCCYAKSEKGWVVDPSGVTWETFVTHGEATTYGDDRFASPEKAAACCGPTVTAAPKVKEKAGACC
jgi:catechol 2,3-dioxygenase-like lactoylglutathione lyase family enzyme